MFCLIYKFWVNPGQEELFREGWRSVTAAVRQRCGSLGARLHNCDDGSWVAYAQWPSRELWIIGEEAINEWMQGVQWDEKCLAKPIELLMELEMTDDLLDQGSAEVVP